jgi:hypothetical protein
MGKKPVLFDFSAAGAPVSGNAPAASPIAMLAAVPEPGTLGLLAAGALAGGVLWAEKEGFWILDWGFWIKDGEQPIRTFSLRRFNLKSKIPWLPPRFVV